jgi:hypothetical protein
VIERLVVEGERQIGRDQVWRHRFEGRDSGRQIREGYMRDGEIAKDGCPERREMVNWAALVAISLGWRTRYKVLYRWFYAMVLLSQTISSSTLMTSTSPSVSASSSPPSHASVYLSNPVASQSPAQPLNRPHPAPAPPPSKH